MSTRSPCLRALQVRGPGDSRPQSPQPLRPEGPRSVPALSSPHPNHDSDFHPCGSVWPFGEFDATGRAQGGLYGLAGASQPRAFSDLRVPSVIVLSFAAAQHSQR